MFPEVSSLLSGYLQLFCTQLSLNSAQSLGKNDNNRNVTEKNYLKESLLTILCFIIQGKGSSEKGLILNCEKFI